MLSGYPDLWPEWALVDLRNLRRCVAPPRAGNMRLSTSGIFTAARQRDGDSRRGGGVTDRPSARGGRFHLCELASTATRVGLSNLREVPIRSIAGGVVDPVQFSLVGNWALGVINLMTKCQTY